MRRAVLLMALFLSAACARDGASGYETYSCANGPDLAVTYADDSVAIVVGNGKSVTLPKVEDGIYARNGIVFQSTGFRTARYTDPTSSFHCDQMLG